MKKLTIFTVFGLVLFSLTSSAWAFGEKPEFEPSDEIARPKTLGVPIVAKLPTPSIKVAIVNVLTEDEIVDLKKKFQDSLKQNQFSDAFLTLEKIPPAYLSKKEKEYMSPLRMFSQIDSEIASANPLFQKDGEVDEEVKKNGARWYKEAQSALLRGDNTLAKDLLIQILYTQRWHFKSKKLLDYGLELPPGSYRIENVVAKYEEKSKISFYGGNYEGAVEALNTLLLFKQEDPSLYEKLGSAYYMMGESKKAIEAWGTSLYFNPGNKDLEKIVANAKTALEEDKKEAKEKEKNQKATTVAKAAPVETQIFGVYRTKNEAYNFAGELKKKGMAPIVEETDNGKWAVKVPVSQLQKKN